MSQGEAAESTDHDTALAAVEAVLMVTEEPVPLAEISAAVGLEQDHVKLLIEHLRAEADGAGPDQRERGYELRYVAGGYRYYSRMRYAEQVSAFVLGGQTARLSQAALETVAVIAYRQPVARSQVAAIRGVSVDGVIRTLVHRGLVDTAGTDPVTGATLYATTTALLEKLGIDSVDDLPALSPHLPGIEAAEGIGHGFGELADGS